MNEREDIPEGVIDADPAGGWESGETSDSTTAERNADSIQKPDLTDAGLPGNVPQGEDATADKKAEHPHGASDPDEGGDSRDEGGSR